MRTYTFVELEISQSAWAEICEKLLLAGYDHAIHDGVIDMQGIAVTYDIKEETNGVH